jgi:hypothetical protein
MTGRSTCRAITRITASLKTPGLPVLPVSTVGLTRATTSSREKGLSPVDLKWSTSSRVQQNSVL